MNFIDFHVDTLIYWLKQQQQGFDKDATLYNNPYHVDLNRLIKCGYTAQFFATYINLGENPFFSNSLYNDALFAIEKLQKEVSLLNDISITTSFDEYKKNKEKKKHSVFISIEEGGIIDNDITRLDSLYERGVRAITLTWNYENCIGYPHEKKGSDFGLKPFGFEVIEQMENLGILIDVSHLSDQGFWDVYNTAKKPFIATHSNARSVHDNSRNLTDEMIKTLADRGGVVGLNFYGPFLQGNENSSVDAMLKHIKHIVTIGGEEVLALGSDFDGIEGNLELCGVHDIHKLVQGMQRDGLSSNLIEKICYKNAENFLERAL